MTKILVAYFSAEGTTRKVAEKLSAVLGADLFEIRPSEPYTAADIKWTIPLSRCNREKVLKRPVPSEGTIGNFDEYDTVFIGFPIWYGGAPNIITTFAKKYDFTGKKIALFATSGGSPIGKTAEKFEPALNGKGTLLGAVLFKADASEEELKQWFENL